MMVMMPHALPSMNPDKDVQKTATRLEDQNQEERAKEKLREEKKQ